MARRYTISPKWPKSYLVTLWNMPQVIRPTREAAGMSYTNSRSKRHRRGRPKRPLNMDALYLLVRGTIDTLRSIQNHTEKGVCPCCGSKTGKLRLNEAGRFRLKAARRRAAKRRQS